MKRIKLYEQIMQQLAQGSTEDAQQVFSQIVRHSLAEALQTDKHQTLTEIRWNSPEVVNSALDAEIYCGFEAETLWPDRYLDDDNEALADRLDNMTFYEIESEFLSDRQSNNIWQDYNDALIESYVYADAIEVATRDLADRLFNEEEDRLISDYVDSALDAEDLADELQEYNEGVIASLERSLSRWQSELDQERAGEADANMIGRYQYKVEQAQEQLADWKSQSSQELTVEYIKQEADAREEFEQWLYDHVSDEYFGEIHDEARQIAEENYPIEEYLQQEYGTIYSALIEYNVDLPNSGSMADIANDAYVGWIQGNSEFEDYDYGGYHQTSGTTRWRFETDSSITGDGAGVEIISPVFDNPRKMLAEMQSLFAWLESQNVETNRSTGLHITMSMPGEQPEANAVKMAVMLDDVYLLKEFGRLGNTYTHSQLEYLKDRVADAATGSERSIEDLEKMLENGISRQKFSSINFKDRNDDGNQLIEFRIAGGADYIDQLDKIQNLVVRYATTMQVGYDSDAYRREYATKLVRMLNNALDLDVGEQPYDVDQTLQLLTQAVKELNITNAYIRSAVVKKLRWLNTHMPSKPDGQDQEKLDVYLTNIREIIYWMAEAVSEGQVKNDPTMRIARMLRTVLKNAGLGIMEIASGMQRSYMTPEERINALAKLLAAPKLVDKFGLREIRKVFRIGSGSLLVHGSAINHALAGEYDQIDPDDDFATTDHSILPYLQRLGYNTDQTANDAQAVGSEEFEKQVLPKIQSRVQGYLSELEKTLGAPVQANLSVHPISGDVLIDLTADLSKPVQSNMWYVLNLGHSSLSTLIPKFEKAGISFR